MATLIVADDESLVTDFLTFVLEREGHSVHIASNGREALELVSQVRPALIITDLMMPVMSGLELARCVRQGGGSDLVPIILCSGVARPVTQQEQHLFVAVLRKPYLPARLVALVQEHTGSAK